MLFFILYSFLLTYTCMFNVFKSHALFVRHLALPYCKCSTVNIIHQTCLFLWFHVHLYYHYLFFVQPHAIFISTLFYIQTYVRFLWNSFWLLFLFYLLYPSHAYYKKHLSCCCCCCCWSTSCINYKCIFMLFYPYLFLYNV